MYFLKTAIKAKQNAKISNRGTAESEYTDKTSQFSLKKSENKKKERN